MKCPNCDGKGYWQEDMPDKFMGKFKQTKVWECDRCNGSGEVSEVEMTNEEWRRTCSTEEFAEWLGDKLDYCQIMWYWACDKCTWSKKHESCMNDKEKWLEWLKQPHKED